VYDTQHDLVGQNILQRFIAESEEYNFIIEQLIHWSYKKTTTEQQHLWVFKIKFINYMYYLE